MSAPDAGKLLALALIALSGCASRPPALPPDPFGAIGPGASCYLFVPVPANRPLLEAVAGSSGFASSSGALLSRTELVYAGFGGGSSALLATGSFPKGASPVLFREAGGWEKRSEKGAGVWYHSQWMDAAIPKSGLVCAATGGRMPALLLSLERPASFLPPSGIDPAFTGRLASAAASGEICLFVADPAPLLARILGPEISFPVSHAEIYARPAAPDGVSYTVSARIELGDPRSARALVRVLSVTLALPLRLDGSALVLDGYAVSREKLVDMAGFLVF